MKTKIHILNKQTRSVNEPVPNGIDVLEEIIADEGMWLTQAEDVIISERVVGISVMLGKGCSSIDWKEITDEEANKIKQEKEEFFEEYRKRIEEEYNDKYKTIDDD